MPAILFDMDGTLYSFENGSYRWSKLESEVQKNMYILLKRFEWDNTQTKFGEIQMNYGEAFSIAFEELYNMKKELYFQTTWDLDPEGLIWDTRNPKEVFTYLKEKGYDLYIVSESPMIWIERVLSYLKISDMITKVYSWQWEERKSNGRLYDRIIKELGTGIYMIGDQIPSDIIMARRAGLKPILISTPPLTCPEADYTIQALSDLYAIIK